MKRYKFVGKNGSCGYSYGKTYYGFVKTASNGRTWFYPLNPNRIIVPYQSLYNFYNNWERA